MPKTKKKRPKHVGFQRMATVHPLSKWKEAWLVDVYELAKQGFSLRSIGDKLGVGRDTFKSYVKKYRAIREIYYRVRNERFGGMEGKPVPFTEHVFGRLTEDAKALWKQVVSFDKKGNTQMVQAMLADQGKRMRQNLFLYAWTYYNWNKTRACQALGMSHTTIEKWFKDPGFANLCKELHEAKKDFFESAFVRKVKEGDTACVLFAVKTQLADRGYGVTKTVKHEGQVEHKHDHTFNLEDLKLTTEEKKRIRDAIRARQEGSPMLEGTVVSDQERKDQ